MMNKILYSIILVSVIFSCSQPKNSPTPETPENLIEKDKFIQILSDVQMLEAALKLRMYKGKNLRERTPGYYHQILDQYQISKDQFSNSLEYYITNEQDRAETFKLVETELKKRKEKEEKLEEVHLSKPKDTPDTLSKKP